MKGLGSPADGKEQPVALGVGTLMNSVGITGTLLGLVVHVRAVVREEDDFAVSVLMLEGIALVVLAAIAYGVGIFVGIIRNDDAYGARLRRDATPVHCPWPVTDIDDRAFR